MAERVSTATGETFDSYTITNVAITATAVTWAGLTSADASTGFLVQADPSNAGKIAVGGSNVTCAAGAATDGVVLVAGATLSVSAKRLAELYLCASAAGNAVHFLKL